MTESVWHHKETSVTDKMADHERTHPDMDQKGEDSGGVSDHEDDYSISAVQITMFRCNKCDAQFMDKNACKNHAEKAHKRKSVLTPAATSSGHNEDLTVLGVTNEKSHIKEICPVKIEESYDNVILPLENVHDTSATSEIKVEPMLDMDAVDDTPLELFQSPTILPDPYSSSTPIPHVIHITPQRPQVPYIQIGQQLSQQSLNGMKLNCSVCQAEFVSFEAINAHLLTHKSEASATPMGQQKHYITVSPQIAEQLHFCTTCKMNFRDKASFENHMKNHANVKHIPAIYECAICRKGYPSKEVCEYHLKTCHQTQSGDTLPGRKRAILPKPVVNSRVLRSERLAVKPVEIQNDNISPELPESLGKYKMVTIISKNANRNKELLTIVPGSSGKPQVINTKVKNEEKNKKTSTIVSDTPGKVKVTITKVKNVNQNTKMSTTVPISPVKTQEVSAKVKKAAPTVYECSFCSTRIQDLKFYEYHLRTMHSKEAELNTSPMIVVKKDPKIVPRCDDKNSTYAPRILHLDAYMCVVCKGTFESKELCEKHAKNHGQNYKETPDAPRSLRVEAYMCPVCKVTFESKELCERHAESHGPKKSNLRKSANTIKHLNSEGYMCSVCKVTFESKELCEKHSESHDPNIRKLFRCKICQDIFANRQDCAKHLKTHIESGVCTCCGKNFETEIDLLSHVAEAIRQTKNQELQCAQCDSKFTTKQKLSRHLKIQHPEDKSAKKVERKSDTSKSTRLDQMMQIKDQRTMSDSDDEIPEDEEFPNELSNLMQDINDGGSDSDTDDFEEEDLDELLAEEKAKNVEEFRAYLSKSLEEAPKEGQCSPSNTNIDISELPCHQVTYENLLIKHIREVEVEARMRCYVCDTYFDFEEEFMNHIRDDHLKKVLFEKGKDKYMKTSLVCKLCGKVCKTMAALTNHVSNHSSDGAPKCHFCDLDFETEQRLNKHMYDEHDNEWPHKCDTCSKGYFDAGRLAVHVLTHGMDRPHECRVCKRKFLRKWDVTKHERTHTEGNRYQCEICGYGCKTSETLRRHLKAHADGTLGKRSRPRNNSPKKKHKTPKTSNGPRQRKPRQRKTMNNQCPHCGLMFYDKKGWEFHIAKHEGRQLFYCDICSLSFDTEILLMEHFDITHEVSSDSDDSNSDNSDSDKEETISVTLENNEGQQSMYMETDVGEHITEMDTKDLVFVNENGSNVGDNDAVTTIQESALTANIIGLWPSF